MKKIELTVAERIAITEKAMEFFKNYQENHSQQNTATPVDAVVDIINNLDVAGKSVVVVANFDVFICMQYLNQKFDLGITDLQLVTDVKLNFASDKIIYVDSFKEIKLTKKFDVAILNPPYSLDLENGQRNRKFGYQIFDQLSFSKAAVILPVGQLKTRKTTTLQGKGLYKAVPCDDAFASAGITIDGVFTFYFDPAAPATLEVIDSIKNSGIATTQYPARNSYSVIKRGLPTFKGIDPNNSPKERYLTALGTADNVVAEPVPGKIRLFWRQNLAVNIDETEVDVTLDKSRGYWRVIQGRGGSPRKMGGSAIIEPSAVVMRSCTSWCFDTREEAEAFQAYLYSDEVTSILKIVKTAQGFSQHVLKCIPMPESLK